jgi:hypothetical protein
MRPWLSLPPSQVTISRRREAGGSAAITAPKDLQVIGHHAAPGAAAAQLPGQRLAGVAVDQQLMVPESL